MAVTRVLLVDDESLVRRTLKQILSAYKDLEVVGEAIRVVDRQNANFVILWLRKCVRP